MSYFGGSRMIFTSFLLYLYYIIVFLFVKAFKKYILQETRLMLQEYTSCN